MRVFPIVNKKINPQIHNLITLLGGIAMLIYLTKLHQELSKGLCMKFVIQLELYSCLSQVFKIN